MQKKADCLTLSICSTHLQTTLCEYADEIKTSNCSYPTRAKCHSLHFFSFKSHWPLRLHRTWDMRMCRCMYLSSKSWEIFAKLWKKLQYHRRLHRTSLLFAQVKKGRYIKVLKLFSPLQGFANTLPFSFSDAMVKPKWSVIDGTRGPLPVSWKSICEKK